MIQNINIWLKLLIKAEQNSMIRLPSQNAGIFLSAGKNKTYQIQGDPAAKK